LKLYLHGPREGQTIKIRDIQFVNGVAEYPVFPETLKKFYGVRDYPANEGRDTEGRAYFKEDIVQKIEPSISNEQEEVLNDDLQVEKQEAEEEVKGIHTSIATVDEGREDQEEAQKELRELIESKKQEMSSEESNPTKLKTYKEFSKFSAFRKYVKDLTGLDAKNKVIAEQLIREYADKNNLQYGDE